jgi:hypothetical protein
MDRGSRMTLYDEMLDAEPREEQRQREADETAADDQNRDLLIRLDRSPTLSRAGSSDMKDCR